MSESSINVHKRTFDIAWGDMDALGHVNNARYFDYFQEARVEWLRSINLDMSGSNGPVVIHASGTFLKPIVYPARVSIHSTLESIGTSSLQMDHHIYQHGILMAHGSSKIVWVDYAKGKSVPLPEVIRVLFE